MKTIVALATPPGISGIAVIRVSGKDSFTIVDSIFSAKNNIQDSNSHTIHYGKIYDDGNLLDWVTVSVFREPNSYTGENVAEISCHGGSFVADSIISLLINKGCRPAEPGEYTKRAFLNGKMDLTQVEAVADLIHSESVPGFLTAARQMSGKFTKRLKTLREQLLNISSLLELETDFAEEDIDLIQKEKLKSSIIEAQKYCSDMADSYKAASILRSGYYVAIAGFPNSGKSTLFNALLNKERAIVSKQPGTTRDYLQETLLLEGISVKIFDTAGLRSSEDIIEIEGIRLAESVLEQSNLIFVLNDFSIAEEHSSGLSIHLKEKFPNTDIISVQNKIDKIETVFERKPEFIYISAKQIIGIDVLKKFIIDKLKKSKDTVQDFLLNLRQSNLLSQSAESLDFALSAVDDGFENEIIALDIKNAAEKLGEITGESWNEEVLNHIFSKFCIGK